MLWKNLPVEIQERMLEEQVLQSNERNEDVFINYLYNSRNAGGFNWELSKEGELFWTRILCINKIDLFYDKYPKNVLKQTNMQQLTRKTLLTAYKQFTCNTWSGEVLKLISLYPLAEDSTLIDIPQSTLDLISESASTEQKDYIKSLGINLIGYKNAFIKEMGIDALTKFSTEAFGNHKILMISGATAVDNGRKDLDCKCLAVHKDYEVKLIETSNGKTIIEILKK